MAKVKTGVFPVYDLDIKVGATKEAVTSIADMETAEATIDTNIETWNALDTKGWQRALATAKALTIAFSGKRNYGDTGNDFIFNKWNKNGRDCDAFMSITFPDGAILECNFVVNVTKGFGGGATDVGPLEFEMVSNGEPVYTEAPTGA